MKTRWSLLATTVRAVPLLALATLVSGCATESGLPELPPVAESPRPLPNSSPQEQSVDSAMLETAYRHAETLGPLFSLVVLRNGTLIGESYFNGASPGTAYNIKSVSKSILSALVGIAIEKGFIESVDQPIAGFFPDYFQPAEKTFDGWASLKLDTDAQKRAVTVRHLLTHTSGYAWEENKLITSAWFWSSDYVRFFLELPFAGELGERFIYTTGGTHVISALIERAAGMSTLEFADRYLFEPIGMKARRWDRAPEGNYIGGAEVHLTARDMARFGLLYLNEGLWRLGASEGRQVLPVEWVRESTRESVRANYESGAAEEVAESWSWSYLQRGDFTGYGYLWWRRSSGGHETFVALGYGGQFIVVIPDLQLVITATSTFDPDKNPDRMAHYVAFFDLIDDHILPSIH